MKVLGKQNITVFLLFFSITSQASPFDPRNLEARMRHTDDGYNQYYGNDANGNPMYMWVSDDHYRLQLFSENELIFDEPKRSSRRDVTEKIWALNTEIKQKISDNKKMELSITDGNWVWVKESENPVWRESPQSIDPRNSLISLKADRVEIWDAGHVVFVENHGGHEDSALAKAVQLKIQLAKACREQKTVALSVDSTRLWSWLSPTNFLMLNPDPNPGPFTIFLSKKTVAIMNNNTVVFMERHTGEDYASEKANLLLNQVLQACREGQSTDLSQTSDGKWAWLDITGDSLLKN